MSFAALETSRSLGRPVELYLFRYGEPEACIFAFTDHERTVTVDDAAFSAPVAYAPLAISREEIAASGTLDKASLEVTLPQDNGLIDLFRLYPPSGVVALTIFQGHVPESTEEPWPAVGVDFLAAWAGRVLAFGIEGIEAKLNCEPASTSMRRIGLRRHWQYGCPHVLYGDHCRADKEAATSNHVVLTVNGPILTFDPGWATAGLKPKHQGGLAEWTLPDGRVEIRTILRCDPDGTVLIGGTATGLIAGATVSLVLGCNHQAGIAVQPDGDCGPLHDNILNFGGDPWIPVKNPVGLVNNFY